MTIAKVVSVDVKTNAKMSLKHFSYEEFDSPDAVGSGVNMDNEFLRMLDLAREIANISFKINSGFRSEKHNQSVGGKSQSSHLIGKAADISYKNSRERYIIITALQEAGFNRLGIAKTFVHVDNDETKSADVIWTY
jgi:hypothetical protein